MPSPRRQGVDDVDLSSIQPPVKLGVTGAEQISRCLAGGSEEIKHLLKQECRIIFECCACTSLFRSLANFLAHKRVYCQEDHLIPSNEVASHVSILRQYVQTKAASMATLAESSIINVSEAEKNSEQLKPAASANGSSAPNRGGTVTTTPTLPKETPKRKKVKCLCENDHTLVQPAKACGHDQGPSIKKKKVIGVQPKALLKKAPTNKMPDKLASIINGIVGKQQRPEANNGVVFNIEEMKKKTIKKTPQGEKKGRGATEKKSKERDLKDKEPSVQEIKTKDTKENITKEEKNVRENVIALSPKSIKENSTALLSSPISVIEEVEGKPQSNGESPKVDGKIVKPKVKASVGPHLLYPCLYCENVFPGTRMAIDHISEAHKKKKALNVSRIRTKIRKKAFLWKAGKKMRQFQKKPKVETQKQKKNAQNNLDNSNNDKQKKVTENISNGQASEVKPNEKEPATIVKVNKRKPGTHICSNCKKVYMYKSSMQRHKEVCITKSNAATNFSDETSSIGSATSVSKSSSPQANGSLPKVSSAPPTLKPKLMGSPAKASPGGPSPPKLKAVSSPSKATSSSEPSNQKQKIIGTITKLNSPQAQTSPKTKVIGSIVKSSSAKPKVNSKIQGTKITPKKSPGLKTNGPKLSGVVHTPAIAPKYQVIEIVIPNIQSAKSEPNTPSVPASTPSNSKIKKRSPKSAPTKTQTSESSNRKKVPIVIPQREEYPCPYCVIKGRKTFELLFKHISTKHKDLRPSRARVAHFMATNGYRCHLCKTTPQYFENRVALKQHRLEVHGVSEPLPSEKQEEKGNKAAAKV